MTYADELLVTSKDQKAIVYYSNTNLKFKNDVDNYPKSNLGQKLKIREAAGRSVGLY